MQIAPPKPRRKTKRARQEKGESKQTASQGLTRVTSRAACVASPPSHPRPHRSTGRLRLLVRLGLGLGVRVTARVRVRVRVVRVRARARVRAVRVRVRVG